MSIHRSYFRVAFRHARKYKSATFIHFSGLMLGLAALFYIALFVKNELSFDHMHANADELYRVLRLDTKQGSRGQSTSAMHAKALKEQYPFIKACSFGNDPVKMGEIDPILVEDFYWSDSTFFELFSFPVLHGDPATCLKEINSVVLTRSLCLKLFGKENVVGESIKVKVFDGNKDYLMQVTGVVEDPPKDTHIQFQALGSMANARELYASLVDEWGFSWVSTYIQVPAGRIGELESGMPKLAKTYFGDNPPMRFGMDFQPFNKVYLHSQDIPKNTLQGNIKNLRIFGAIGLLILLVSLMNYVNLATARAITRSKEVGIRKVLGSQRQAIIMQFIIESLLFTFVSGLAAIALLLACLPWLNSLFERELSFQSILWYEWSYLVLFLLLLGIGAGLLPSIIMSKLPVISNNKSAIKFKPANWSFTRKFFVGVQYLVTLGLLVGTMVIYQQYQYLKNFDLGFDSKQLLHLKVEDRLVQSRMDLLKERMLKVPGVLGVSATGEDLPSALNNTWSLRWSGMDPERRQGIDVVGVDQDYFDLLDVPFVEGENFRHNFQVDSARSVILNQKALSVMGLDKIAGKQIIVNDRERKVVGVVEDHHNTTLHSEIAPLAYFIFPPGLRVSPDNLLLKVETQNVSELIPQLKAVWKEFSSDPLAHNFVDESFSAAYSSEKRFSSLIFTFTIIAIVISIVGLFGLISFIVELKLKEISIRRVLGASQLHLINLLGKDFFIVFGISMLFALPISYYFLNVWLENYIYRIQINGMLIFWAVILCLSISLLVILFHLQRASRITPTEVIGRE